jgi:hypothetical protein
MADDPRRVNKDSRELDSVVLTDAQGNVINPDDIEIDDDWWTMMKEGGPDEVEMKES